MRPLRVKASSYPVSSSNFQGLQEMTDAEIQSYYSAILTKDFADNTDGTGTAEINVTTNASGAGTTIGTATDTKRTDAVGTHPTGGGTTTVTTYTAKQVDSTASESITNRPLGYVSSGSVGAHQFDDTELDTDIIDKAIASMVGENEYTIGQYQLSASAPSGGTWTSRYTLTDTQVDGTTANKYIWQKTAATTAAVSNNKPVAYKGSGNTGVNEMTVAEMEEIVPNFRNRIIANTIGTYKLQSGSPSGGTWVQMGDSYTDTRKEVASQNYAGSYTGSYTGGYTGAKNYAGTYSGSYTGSYTGTYTGTSAYAGTYSGAYAGTYTQSYSGYAGTSYTGYYTGSYTGYYTGAKNYAGTYSGAYSGSYTGYYTGTSAYSGTYSGTYTGYYAGDTVQSSAETASTVKLWVKTAN